MIFLIINSLYPFFLFLYYSTFGYTLSFFIFLIFLSFFQPFTHINKPPSFSSQCIWNSSKVGDTKSVSIKKQKTLNLHFFIFCFFIRGISRKKEIMLEFSSAILTSKHLKLLFYFLVGLFEHWFKDLIWTIQFCWGKLLKYFLALKARPFYFTCGPSFFLFCPFLFLFFYLRYFFICISYR